MAHNLYGQRLLVRVPAWHFLGTVIGNKQVTLKQALSESHCDFKITAEPIYVLVDGQYVDCSNRVAIVRHPSYEDQTYTVLDVVSSDYQLVTNIEMVDYYDELSKIYPVETMGALGKGETFFFTLDAGEMEVNGELVKQFLLVTDNKVAREQTRVAYTPVPVVCQNTLTTGLKRAIMNLAVPHRTGNKEKLQEIARVAGELQQRIEDVNQLFIGMGKTHISQEDLKKMLEEVIYPTEEEAIPVAVDDVFGFALKQTKNQEAQSAVLDLFEQYNDNNPKYGKTIWNAMQAITDYEDHKKGRGISQYSQMLFGNRADTKAKAFDTLLKTMS